MTPSLSAIDHVSVGVRDFARAKLLYDRALGALGLTVQKGREGVSAGYGHDDHAFFWVVANDGPAPGVGIHFAFAETRAEVDTFHAAAIEAGATDNGAPGIRPLYSQPYYAAFVIDADGNRLEAVCRAPDQGRTEE